MSASRDAGDLLDRVCRALVDGERAAIEAMRRAAAACDAADRARNEAGPHDVRAAARCRGAARQWEHVVGQVDAVQALVTQVVDLGVGPYSRARQAEHAEQVERQRAGASRGWSL